MMEMTSVSERPVTESGGTTGVLDWLVLRLAIARGRKLADAAADRPERRSVGDS